MGKSHWNTSQHYASMEGNVRAIIKHALGDKPGKDDISGLMNSISGLIDKEIQRRAEEREHRAEEALDKARKRFEVCDKIIQAARELENLMGA